MRGFVVQNERTGVILCAVLILFVYMQYPYYEFTIPIFKKMLGSVSHLLDKASEHARTRPDGEQGILNAQLAPDMFPFIRQVRMVCDNAKGAAARLAGIPVPVFEDAETSIAELKARVQKTIAFLDTLTPEQYAHAATVTVELPYFQGKHFEGDGYVRQYVLPNFFFHVTTVYSILRKEGAQIGKADYMNGLPLIDNG
jgi:uncharacterized protein